MKDFDFDEIDQAINEAIADDGRAKSKSTHQDATNPADKFVERKAAPVKPATKPSPRPTSQPVSRPAPQPAPKSATRPASAAKPTPKKPAPRPPVKRQGIYFDVIPAGRKPSATTKSVEDDDVETTFVSQTVTTTTITTIPDTENKDARELAAEEDFIREPEPFELAPDVSVQVRRPVRFVDNVHIEKRPLSNSLPPDHTDNITSTRNTYSHATVTSTENQSGAKKRTKKPARVKTHRSPRAKGNGSALTIAVIVSLIIILGAAAGYLLYLLLAK
jgi:hypothetical protein